MTWRICGKCGDGYEDDIETHNPCPLDAWPLDAFLAEVRAEVLRAREKFPGRELQLVAAGEEFGELFKACLDEPYYRVRKEAIQAAAMAARVALDGDSSLDALRERKALDPIPLPK
jgi:hypothetical protein